MKRSASPLISVLSVLALGAWQQARGELIVYTSRAVFDAATTGDTVIDFSGLAPANSFTFFGSPGTLSVGGATFESSGAMFVQNDGTSSRLSFQQGTPTNKLDVTLPAGRTAVGFDYEAGTVLTLTLDSGASFDLPIVNFPDFDFLGFTTDQPLVSFRLEAIGGGDLKNFTFGTAAVPEPSTLLMLGCGGLMLAGYHRACTSRGRSSRVRREGNSVSDHIYWYQ